MKENIKEWSPVSPMSRTEESDPSSIESPLEQSGIVWSILDWQGYYD